MQVLAKADLLGPDVCWSSSTTPAPIEGRFELAETKTPVSLSPFTELRTGFGMTPVARLPRRRRAAQLSRSIRPLLCGNADMFAIMKACRTSTMARRRASSASTARRVLEMATIDGARALGIADRVGSLTPGKRADIILVRTDATSTWRR